MDEYTNCKTDQIVFGAEQDNDQKSMTSYAFKKDGDYGVGFTKERNHVYSSCKTGLRRKEDADNECSGTDEGLCGRTINDTYRIIERLGSGSGGIVYLACHLRLNKQVVLKKIKVPHRNIEENRREADILKQLKHSCLPLATDFITVDDEVYTVMDFIEGGSLQERLQKGQRFSQEESVKYICQLLEALVYLHGQPIPIIHGDIKPSNIMLTPDGNICLIDFNVSGYLTDSNIQVTGYTEGYAAPEQEKEILAAIQLGRSVRSEAIDTRSDLYSVGAVLFKLLTGEKPFKEWSKMQQILEADGISDGIIQVVFRSLRHSPDERYATAAEMLGELRNYKKLESGYRKKILFRRIIVCAIAIILITALLARVHFWQSDRKEKEKKYQGMLASLEALIEEVKDESKQGKEQTGKNNSGEFNYEQGDGSKGAYEEAQRLYSECVSLFPDRIAPLVGMARFLSATERYEECIRLIRGDAFENDMTDSEETVKACGKLYYLLGNCYEQTGNPEEAIQAYALAIEKDETSTDYYRDYAIALAQNGYIEKAEEILLRAEKSGLVQGQIYLVRGEILANEGRYDEAIEELSSCINGTENDMDLLRAYILSAEAYEKKGITIENIQRAATLLEEAKTRLPEEKKAPILECLAQCYIYLYDMTEVLDQAENAISIFEEIIFNGWSSAMTYNNIIVLLQKTDNMADARQFANEMIMRYPNDYRSYKRMAFLDNALEERKEQDERNYDEFVEHYRGAHGFYEEQNSDSEDMEMRILDDLYVQLTEKGWI